MKLCANCGKMKPLEDFPHNRRSANGEQRMTVCNKCNRERLRVYYQLKKLPS